MATPTPLSIPRSLISTPTGTLLPTLSSYTSPEQQALLTSHSNCALLAKIYYREFTTTREKAHLDFAITLASRCLDLYESDDAVRKKYLYLLGKYSGSRHKRLQNNDAEDRYNAIKALRASLSALDDDSEAYPETYLTGLPRARASECLGWCLKDLYEKTARSLIFDDALRYLKDAVRGYKDFGAAEGKSEALVRCYLAGAELWRLKGEKMESDEDGVLESGEVPGAKESKWANNAVDAAVEGEGLWFEAKEALAGAYFRAYQGGIESESERDDDSEGDGHSQGEEIPSRDRSLLDLAIEHLEDVAERVDESDGNKDQLSRYHFQLGRMHFALVKVTQDSDDGSEASSHIQRSLQLTPRNHPSRPERVAFWHESADYLSKNDRLGLDIRGRPTLAEICAFGRRIDKVADEDPEEAARLSEEKAFMYYARYQSMLRYAEALSAVEVMEESVEITPSENEEQSIERRRTIAFLCDRIFAESQRPSILDRGIPYAREAVELCESASAVGDNVKALTFHTAARILSDRFQEDDEEDTEVAAEIVRYAARAVQLISNYCDKDDGCQECEDRGMFKRDLESMRKLVETDMDEPKG
ncbi:hypothetical protein BJY04DRAFT_196996 [Aspergillus karnatakaensis]|uniref:uncharacterized protein n=1 Tax=Aspergillus karnatakaensis TaxID=1810916 RepID=UPI003CCD8D35